MPTDAADPQQFAALIDRVVAGYGRLDIAINNAASNHPAKPVAQVTLDEFDDVIAVNNERGAFDRRDHHRVRPLRRRPAADLGRRRLATPAREMPGRVSSPRCRRAFHGLPLRPPRPGDSGDTPTYAVEREIEDLEALVNEAGGSAYAFGMSSGAVLVLDAAAHGVALRMLALYEPPFDVDDSRPPVPGDYVAQLDERIATLGSLLVARAAGREGLPRRLDGALHRAVIWARATDERPDRDTSENALSRTHAPSRTRVGSRSSSAPPRAGVRALQHSAAVEDGPARPLSPSSPSDRDEVRDLIAVALLRQLRNNALPQRCAKC